MSKQPRRPDLVQKLGDRLSASERHELDEMQQAAKSHDDGLLGRAWHFSKEAAIVIGLVWFISQEWNTVKRDVAELSAALKNQPSISTVQADIQGDIQGLRGEIAIALTKLQEAIQAAEDVRTQTERALGDVRRRLSQIEVKLEKTTQGER